MNSSKHGRNRRHAVNIEYWMGDRMLRDSAMSFEHAKAKIAARSAKRHNKGETARVYDLRRNLILDTACKHERGHDVLTEVGQARQCDDCGFQDFTI